MKLRIKGDSLRLRLTQGDVASLLQNGNLVEQMSLVDGSFRYQLRSSTSAEKITAALRESMLSVSIPDQQMRSWADSTEVSLADQDGPVKILVEKDFACLKPRDGEDDADAYPHPDAADG
ncbi:MAG: hypothetical protein KJO35_02125 [Gammaproteobacteria bacterium]|nr:hypothetical protein [Gammaproteobacteria bacterium]NNF67430.1 hypothetical protein [Gammaproteobacteria bacterium]